MQAADFFADHDAMSLVQLTLAGRLFTKQTQGEQPTAQAQNDPVAAQGAFEVCNSCRTWIQHVNTRQAQELHTCHDLASNTSDSFVTSWKRELCMIFRL